MTYLHYLLTEAPAAGVHGGKLSQKSPSGSQGQCLAFRGVSSTGISDRGFEAWSSVCLY